MALARHILQLLLDCGMTICHERAGNRPGLNLWGIVMIYEASIYFRPEKPYGIGNSARERASRIVPGFRGEVISGLNDGLFVYTGVCATKDECKAELISHLKRLGLTGKLRIV